MDEDDRWNYVDMGMAKVLATFGINQGKKSSHTEYIWWWMCYNCIRENDYEKADA